jgi:putative transposase
VQSAVGDGGDYEDLRDWVEPNHAQLSLRRQCALLGISRASLYYEPAEESQENLALMRLIDRQYTRVPFYGSRRMTAWLQGQGHAVNRKRVVRLMRQMGIEAVYAKPKLSRPGEGHKIYPYLLKEKKIERKNQVWCTDITYIPMGQGFLYLVAVMDWFSRFVLSWRLSLTMELEFCLEKLTLRRHRSLHIAIWDLGIRVTGQIEQTANNEMRPRNLGAWNVYAQSKQESRIQDDRTFPTRTFSYTASGT